MQWIGIGCPLARTKAPACCAVLRCPSPNTFPYNNLISSYHPQSVNTQLDNSSTTVQHPQNQINNGNSALLLRRSLPRYIHSITYGISSPEQSQANTPTQSPSSS